MNLFILRNIKNNLVYILIITWTFIFLSVAAAIAGNVTLSWSPPLVNKDGTPLTDFAGYTIYYGLASGDYTNSIDIGNVIPYQLNNLPERMTYYFAVTAYDTSGNESGYSNEVARYIPQSSDIPDIRVPVIADKTFDIDLGDVDGDGDLDAIVANAGEEIGLLINVDGFGVYSDQTSSRMPCDIWNSREADFGDVDGDGDLDIIVANMNNEQNLLLINDGVGYFTDETVGSLPIDSETSYDVDFGDVDGDGDLDIFVANHGQNRLLINDGTGHYNDTTAVSIPADSDISFDPDFGDVDDDGDLDIFIANLNGQNRLYINDGTGNFADENSFRLPEDTDKSIEGTFGDVDDDGDLDILVVNNSRQNRLLINDGTGVFIDETSSRLPIGIYADNDGAFGDVDGDTDLDIVIGCASVEGCQNRLLINNGRGFFRDETLIRMPSILDTTTEIELGDVDGDGYPDIFEANGAGSGKKQNGLLINDGTGRFTDTY